MDVDQSFGRVPDILEFRWQQCNQYLTGLHNRSNFYGQSHSGKLPRILGKYEIPSRISHGRLRRSRRGFSRSCYLDSPLEETPKQMETTMAPGLKRRVRAMRLSCTRPSVTTA